MECWNCKGTAPENAVFCDVSGCRHRGDPARLRFGKYRVLTFESAGAFGEVYRVFDPDLRRVRALKHFVLSGSDLATIRNELELAARIDHPNVVRILDAEPDDAYYVMELLEGGTLEEHIRREPEQVRRDFIELARKVCSGLQAAHQQRICHRDLKPDNIIFDGNGNPKITDFGISRLVTPSNLGKTEAGTPLYMAPEVWEEDGYDLRADIFSLGVIFYRIWTSEFPFNASTRNGIRLKAAKGEYVLADERNRSMPPRVARLIDGMIQPKVEDRIATIDQVDSELFLLSGAEWSLKSVNDYQLLISTIYGRRNHRRSPVVLLAHLSSAATGLVGGVIRGETSDGRARAVYFLPIVFGWLCALASSLEWRVSQVIDFKYSEAKCPHCDSSPCHCQRDHSDAALNQSVIAKIRERGPITPGKPRLLTDYRVMFDRIYGERNRQAGLVAVSVVFLNAINAVGDALLRLRSLEDLRQVDILHLELADLTAWYFALANTFDPQFDLDQAFLERFSRVCYKCGETPCSCPPIENEIRLANWRDFS